MGLIANLLLALGFAVAVGAAVQAWRTHLAGARRDGMQALAARRGWAMTVTEERLGRAGTLRLVPRGGVPWVAEARPRESRGGAVTVYEAEVPRWPEGTLVMTAAPDPRAAAAAVGVATARLGPLEGPEGVAVLSDGTPSLRADPALLGQVLRGWAASAPRAAPVLVLSPEGFRLAVPEAIGRPERMEAFLDLALELSRLIGPSA